MMDVARHVINTIIDTEGGYVDDPSDSGGETNHGITKRTARRYGFDGDLRDLTRRQAFSMYKDMYWNSVGGDGLAAISPPVAHEVADTAVNIGPTVASKILQRSLNILNNRGKLYPDILVDGQIGPKTLNALVAYVRDREVPVLMKALNCFQGYYYITLAERREKDEKFVYGWLNKRVHLM